MLRSVVKGVLGVALAAAVGLLVFSLITEPPPEPAVDAPAGDQVARAPDAAEPAPSGDGSRDPAAADPATATPATTEPSGTVGSEPAQPDTQSAAADPAAADPAEADPAEADAAGRAGDAESAPAVTPRFDVVRIAPDGQAVIAGHAGPDRTVEVLLDGAVIASVETDASGAFATVVEIAPASGARQLVLRTAVEDAPDTVVALAPAADTGAAGPGAADAPAAPGEPAAIDGTAAGTDASGTPGAASAPAAPAPASGAGDAPDPDLGEPEPGTGPAANPAPTIRAAAAPDVSDPGRVDPAADPSRLPTTGTETPAAPGAPAIAEAAPGATAPAAPGTTAPVAPIASAGSSATSTAVAAAGSAVQPAAPGAPGGHAGAAPRPGDPARDPGFLFSAPVVILPQDDPATAPSVVHSESEAVSLLQPAIGVSGTGMVLDRITYQEAGGIVAAGRGRPGTVIRVYANAEFLTEVRADDEGLWQVRVPYETAADTLLLRFDEIGAEGEVLSRLETPFEYAPGAVAHELRQREIVVQRGDYLWKFAEQHYGRGIRYSVIYQANAHLIRDPDLIYPGQVFTVPELVDHQ